MNAAAAAGAVANPTKEEYVLLADYVTDTEGELSVSAGDVVQLINREATGRGYIYIAIVYSTNYFIITM